MSSWKIDKWLTAIAPSTQDILDEIETLNLREFVIVAACTLDVALAELIAARLCGPEQEIVDFLGADGDGRAPGGSFGSRIQLARLLGLIDGTDAKILRSIKEVRNTMAHRLSSSASDERVSRLAQRLWLDVGPQVAVYFSFVSWLHTLTPGEKINLPDTQIWESALGSPTPTTWEAVEPLLDQPTALMAATTDDPNGRTVRAFVTSLKSDMTTHDLAFKIVLGVASTILLFRWRILHRRGIARVDQLGQTVRDQFKEWADRFRGQGEVGI